ncbi:MAG: sulfatase [Gemmataceae bacterium]
MLHWKKLLACMALIWMAGPLPAADDKPSILVLLADDVDARDYGCYGNDAIRTPNIDALAKGGLLCENAFLTTSSCSPTRISVLTGKYPHATGAEDLHMPLPADQTFVSTYLKKQGYFTGHMLKTHYGPNGIKQFDWYGKKVDEFPQFLDKAGDKPFFCWVGFNDAHRPYKKGTIDPPHDPKEVKVPPYLADTPETRADLALYYDEISHMDGDIGSMVAELKKRKRFDNTLIVFFGDNGRPFPRAKGTAYDSGIGTPLVFSWPTTIKPGSKHTGLASVIDLAPTFLEIAGLDKPADMQGKSMLPVLKDPSQPGRKYIFAERNWHNCDEHIRCVRSQQYKLIRNAYLELPYGNPSDVSSCPSWKSLLELKKAGKLTPQQELLFRKPRPRLELYDMQKDPWEFDNLADKPEYAKVVKELEAELDRWTKETNDFPPERRRRDDNTHRETGVKFTQEIPKQRE